MTLRAVKRRKLAHGDEDVDSSDDGRSQADDDRVSQDGPAAKSKGSIRPMRPYEDDDHDIYMGGLHKSNMFKLQVDTMLKQVQFNYEKRAGRIDEAIRALKEFMELIEDCEPLSVAEATKKLYKTHKISIPFAYHTPEKDVVYKLLYNKPSKINVIGSYILKSMIQTDKHCAVDMVVLMPSTVFQEKDYLNYRYFHKRAYFLACIAAGLQDSAQGEFVFRFEALNGNLLQPILVATPKNNKSQSSFGFDIRIIPAAPKTLFAESKLFPDRNSIRPPRESITIITPTSSPFYNASLKSDCNMEGYLRLIYSASEHSSGFRKACMLGRIWLRQRGLSSNIAEGGFGHFEWASITALLMSSSAQDGQSVIAPGYSSYQMFKAVLQFIGTNNLVSKPMLHGAQDVQISVSDMPVFYDSPRGQDLLFKMSPWSYYLLQEEARTSLAMLNDSAFDQFESTFITRTDHLLHRFDTIIEIPFPAQETPTSLYDYIPLSRSFSKRIYDLLREGLSDRVKLINIREPRNAAWSLKSTGPPSGGKQTLQVAIVFDPSNMSRLVDHGPPAEEKNKAAKFRKFWGERAELRRFKDGRILESLIWSPGSNHSICVDIVTYLIERHVGSEISKNIKFIGWGFEALLKSPGQGTDLKSFDILTHAFQRLENTLREIEGLPLRLRQISPVDPQLRYASSKVPVFNSIKPLDMPVNVLVQFEGSGRWPDNVVAIQRTKIAFLVKIGNLLREADSSTTTRLGLENEDHPLQNCAFLDIVDSSGMAFRLRIHNDREQILLERHIKDKSTQQHTHEEAVNALRIYKLVYIHLPRHSQSIATHCTRFPLLSPTIRLVKMWFSRHMLSRHISEELMELLAARTFLQPYPWQSPSSVMTGFLRTLLYISTWDWRLVPLIVDFSGSMTSTDVTSIQTRLEAWRKIDPGMNRTVLIAASDHDMTGSGLTEKGPSKVIAARMTAVARSACKLVKQQLLDLDPRSLFAASSSDFDFVIRLQREHIDGYNRKATQKHFKNLEVQSHLSDRLLGHDPVELLISELEKLYNASLLFFRGTETSNPVIAGLWNPQTLSARHFKLKLPYTTKPAFEQEGEEQDMVELNKEAILSEIARIGGDMVETIHVYR